MSAFISLPPAGDSAPPSTPDSVAFDGFYPALSLAAARAAMRIPTDITDARLRDALAAAMLEIADDLTQWRAVQDAAGFAVLADCSDRMIAGEKRLVLLWRRAVHHLAAADLAEIQRGPDSTPAGSDRAAQLDSTAADHRRNSRWAVRDMLGIPHTTIELI
ncbi:MAG: head completion/stabilization protein [Betaproteobacteria bacterium]|nr:head completion/stabilization protein [Betaproteobacteria bacterium]